MQQKQNKILERETALSLKEKELQSLSVNLAARIQQRALEASANAMRRIDDAIGSIIDTFA